jgi:hypothetical protein
MKAVWEKSRKTTLINVVRLLLETQAPQRNLICKLLVLTKWFLDSLLENKRSDPFRFSLVECCTLHNHQHMNPSPQSSTHQPTATTQQHQHTNTTHQHILPHVQECVFGGEVYVEFLWFVTWHQCVCVCVCVCVWVNQFSRIGELRYWGEGGHGLPKSLLGTWHGLWKLTHTFHTLHTHAYIT